MEKFESLWCNKGLNPISYFWLIIYSDLIGLSQEHQTWQDTLRPSVLELRPWQERINHSRKILTWWGHDTSWQLNLVTSPHCHSTIARKSQWWHEPLWRNSSMLFYQSNVATVIPRAFLHKLTTEMAVSSSVCEWHPSSLCYPHSNCACTLSPTELTMETKTLFGSGREQIYACVQVWVIIRDVLSFHNEIETACEWH